VVTVKRCTASSIGFFRFQKTWVSCYYLTAAGDRRYIPNVYAMPGLGRSIACASAAATFSSYVRDVQSRSRLARRKGGKRWIITHKSDGSDTNSPGNSITVTGRATRRPRIPIARDTVQERAIDVQRSRQRSLMCHRAAHESHSFVRGLFWAKNSIGFHSFRESATRDCIKMIQVEM